jgi:4-hydroxy-tetrahydrodipicolinate synthase
MSTGGSSKMKEFVGMYPAMITPFTKADTLDEAGLRANIDWYIDEGSHGVSCLGSIGEYVALTDDERKRVIDITVEQVNGRVPVIAGNGGKTTKDTIRWTQYVKDAGADGVLMPNPYYHLPDDEELYEHIKSVALAVDIPIMLYNNVRASGADATTDMVLKLARECDTFTYFKASSGEIQRVSTLIREGGDDVTVFSGDDALALVIFMLGGRGAIDGMAALLPKKRARLFDLVEQGNLPEARELWYRMVPLATVLEYKWHKFIQTLKKGLDLVGRCGGPSLRGPKHELSPQQEAQLKQMVVDLGDI